MILKVLSSGRRIEGLPALAVLNDDAIPAEVAETRAAWLDARKALDEPARALANAEREAGERFVRVEGNRKDWNAKVSAATKEERSDLKDAERSCKSAADAFVSALNEHASTLSAIGARLALAAHFDAIEHALDLMDARARSRVGPSVGTHPLVEDKLLARSRMGVVPETPLDELDRVDVAALAEIAGEEPEAFGFVERVSPREMVSLWTTPRRAERLGKALGVNDWTAREDLA